MTTSTPVAIIGVGPVGRALGAGLAREGYEITFGVRNPADPKHADLAEEASVTGLAEAARSATVSILAIPADAVADAVTALDLRSGQIVLDATNAVWSPLPDGFDTVGAFVASRLADGVGLAKAFNTLGAEHLGDGRLGDGRAFLPIAGDDDAVVAATELATTLGFDVTSLGGRDAILLVEDFARLWIHLAFRCGWGRDFGFTAVRG